MAAMGFEASALDALSGREVDVEPTKIFTKTGKLAARSYFHKLTILEKRHTRFGSQEVMLTALSSRKGEAMAIFAEPTTTCTNREANKLCRAASPWLCSGTGATTLVIQ